MRTVAAPCFRRVMQASVASAALPFAACLSSRLLVGLTRISVLALLLSYVASLPLARATPSPNERSNQAMSQIVVIRHAPAEDREAAHRQGRPAAERALTDEGRAKMTHVAAGLHRDRRRGLRAAHAGGVRGLGAAGPPGGTARLAAQRGVWLRRRGRSRP